MSQQREIAQVLTAAIKEIPIDLEKLGLKEDQLRSETLSDVDLQKIIAAMKRKVRPEKRTQVDNRVLRNLERYKVYIKEYRFFVDEPERIASILEYRFQLNQEERQAILDYLEHAFIDGSLKKNRYVVNTGGVEQYLIYCWQLMKNRPKDFSALKLDDRETSSFGSSKVSYEDDIQALIKNYRWAHYAEIAQEIQLQPHLSIETTMNHIHEHDLAILDDFGISPDTEITSDMLETLHDMLSNITIQAAIPLLYAIGRKEHLTSTDKRKLHDQLKLTQLLQYLQEYREYVFVNQDLILSIFSVVEYLNGSSALEPYEILAVVEKMEENYFELPEEYFQMYGKNKKQLFTEVHNLLQKNKGIERSIIGNYEWLSYVEAIGNEEEGVA